MCVVHVLACGLSTFSERAVDDGESALNRHRQKDARKRDPDDDNPG